MGLNCLVLQQFCSLRDWLSLNIIYLLYLFLAMLGLCCCIPAFSSCIEQGQPSVVERGLLIDVFSLVVEHREALGVWASVTAARRLGTCSLWAELLCSTWDLPGLGIKTVSTALADGFLTTEPLGSLGLSLSIHPLFLFEAKTDT